MSFLRAFLLTVAVLAVGVSAQPAHAQDVADEGKIAFASDQDGDFEIYVMNADGSGLTQLTDNAGIDRSPSWLPDGRRISFLHHRIKILSDSNVKFDMGRYHYNYDLHVMNSDGSGQSRLTYNLAPRADSLNWSPDGQHIAFDSIQDGDREIYVMNADGSEQTQLTHNSATDFISAWDSSPSWSPDGQHIAFYSHRDGDSEIYVMNADGSDQTQLTNNSAVDFGPSWSPDGQHIAFISHRDGDFEIYVMNADGSDQTQLTNNSAVHSWSRLSWSPHGQRIVFDSERDGEYDIYVINADGSEQTQLTHNSVVDFEPSWLPVDVSAQGRPSSSTSTPTPTETSTPIVSTPTLIVPASTPIQLHSNAHSYTHPAS